MLEHRYRYMTRINWSGIAKLAGSNRMEVNHIFAGRKKNKRLSALLATMELPRKIDWRQVAEVISQFRPKTYSPRYVREIACGQRRNANVLDTLTRLGVIEMLERQRSFCSTANKQEAI
ncbi:MAG: hypothetical protein FWF63_07290 [Fibromonadales bacterium]|nr:hypothetical protein [Fibromonadales bacterium]